MRNLNVDSYIFTYDELVTACRDYLETYADALEINTNDYTFELDKSGEVVKGFIFTTKKETDI